MHYPIKEIKDYDLLEQLGTKEKFWFHDIATEKNLLCKLGRPSTGENWAEKAACEIAKLLGIPCASYDLAIWEGKQGVATPSFVPQYGRLVHGNELLSRHYDYPDPSINDFKVREYKLTTVLALMRMLKNTVDLPIGYEENDRIKTISDVFLSYLMLDALISNQDRHHENWGIIINDETKKLHLAPTYDHASSLGCREPEQKIKDRLDPNNTRSSIENFVNKAKTPFYHDDPIKNKKLKPIEAFIIASKKNKDAASYWLERLDMVEDSQFETIFRRLPDNIIMESNIKFALSILKVNKNKLLSHGEI